MEYAERQRCLTPTAARSERVATGGVRHRAHTEHDERWLAYPTPLWWKGEVEVRTKEVARLRIARPNACHF